MRRNFHAQGSGLIFIFLLMIIHCFPVWAQEELSIREQRRKLIPLEKLKIFLEAPKRVQTMQPQRVIDVLGVKKGETVADIGAGTGFFSFYLAEWVSDDGKVFAVEIEDELLEFINEKAKTLNVTNIVPVKSSETSPNLPQTCCNKILIANTYIYFDDPVAFMKNVGLALKPDGLVGIIEVDADQAKSGRRLLLQTKGRVVSEVIDEMKKAGYVLSNSYDFLESRFFLVFTLKKN